MKSYYDRNDVVCITLLDKSTPAKVILQWLRDIYKLPLTVYQAIPIINLLKAENGVWSPDLYDLNRKTNIEGDICDINVVLGDSDFEIFYKKQQEYFKLLELGAAGDAEAAIAYCKAELAHLIAHGPIG